jgi:hypothetical protein
MTKEELNVQLFTDWFGKRDRNTFVHRSKEKRSGWEKNLSDGLSKYLVKKNPGTIDVLREAYRLSKSRVSAMIPGRTVPLSFRGADSYTNGTRIVISTEPADESSLTPFEKLDILLGLTTHEVAHILHTDFDLKFIRDKFQKTILNILEDERIEYLVGEEFPGYGAFLEKLKAYYFDFKYAKKKFSSPGKEAFDCFFKFIRYPKHIDETAVERHADFLSLVKDEITPYPMTFRGAQKASCKIADLFVNYFKEKFEEENPKSDSSTKDASVQDLLDTLADMMQDLDTTSVNPEAVNESKIFKKDPLAEKLIDGRADFLPDSQTYFINADDDQDNYNVIRSSVIGSARSLARLIAIDTTASSFPVTGLRNGIMDEGKLVEAVMNVENIYRQAQPNKNKPAINLVLLVDESGSMEENMEKVRSVAILFNEALKLIPSAKFSVYGYTSDQNGYGTDTITIYKEKAFDRTKALASLEAKRSNRDGRCIRAVVERLSKSRPKGEKTLLFVVSDGQPAAFDYTGPNAIKDTRSAVEEAKAKGFIPIQIGIGVEEEEQAEMFDDFVNYDSSSQMVERIGRLLRSKIRLIAA